MEESPPICYRRFESKRSASCSFPRRDHGFLHDTGIDVKREPKHPKDMFSWVSALYESNRPLTGLNDVRGMSVYIGRKTTTSRLIAHHHHLRTGNVPPKTASRAKRERHLRRDEARARRARRPRAALPHGHRPVERRDGLDARQRVHLPGPPQIERAYLEMLHRPFRFDVLVHRPHAQHPPIDGASQYFIKNKFYSPGTLRKVRELGLIASGSIRSGRLSATSPTRSYRSRRSTGSSSSTEPTRRI